MKTYTKLLFLIICISSCTESADLQDKKITNAESHQQFLEQFDAIREDILDTRKLTFLLKDNGYAYNPTLVNEPELASNYLNAKEQCLNIGVYAADLNYLSVFDKDNQALVYVDAIFDLCNQMSIEYAFDRNYLTEIIKHDIPNYKLKSDEINDIIEQAKEEIRDDERAQVSALILTGGWVEGMFHSISMAQEDWPNEELADELFLQCKSYHNVKRLLEIYKEYPPCDEVYEKFVELEPAISNVTQGDIQYLKDNLFSLQGIMTDLRDYIIHV
ncbi:MAG: hypothetical protein AAF487_10665 [Bacteroidota bacterium]